MDAIICGIAGGLLARIDDPLVECFLQIVMSSEL
jgi:hypothetical protein